MIDVLNPNCCSVKHITSLMKSVVMKIVTIVITKFLTSRLGEVGLTSSLSTPPALPRGF
jgi:hypothetical protein